MNVTVAVINPKITAVARDEFLLRDELPAVHAMSDDLTRGAYQRANNRMAAVYTQIAADYERAGHAAGSPRGDKWLFAADDIRKITIPQISKRYGDEAATMTELEARIRAADSATPRREDYIASLLRQRIQRKRAFIVWSSQGLDTAVQQANNADIGVKGDVTLFGLQQEHAAAVNNLLIGDANITALREAFAVTTAKPDDWSPKYDQSVGTGRFGRVDVAIKMESRGVFTIKGITFDPSEVVRVAAKVTTQALVVGAQLAGVPITKRAGTTGDGAALTTSSSDLNDLEAQQKTHATKNADRRGALLELATTILAQEGPLSSTDNPTVSTAITAIRAKSTAVNTRLTQ
jgi:hypothetical protein